MLMWHDRSGPQPVASFNDLVPSAGSLQGRCQGWTPLARGLFVEGESRLQLRHTASPRWIFITVVRRLRWGWETGGGWIKMLRRWFFKDTSKALPSTAVSKWRWAVGDGEVVGVYFWYRRWHTWWFRAAGRASSTWQQCNKIIRAIRANKKPQQPASESRLRQRLLSEY